MKIFKLNMALKLLIIIALVFIFGEYLPLNIKSALYGLSLFIKQILLFILPLIIFSCLFSCVLSFKHKAFSFMLTLFIAVFIANALALYYGYGVAHFGLTYLKLTFAKIDAVSHQLMPMWDFGVKPFIANEVALILGTVLGLLFTLVKSDKVSRLADILNSYVTIFLNKIFIPVLPLFALGFLLKMQDDGILVVIFRTYAPILLLLVVALVIYLTWMFLLAAGFNLNKTLSYIKNALPAAITGFSTMSGIAALPINMQGAEKNTHDPATVRAVIPACTNIHMTGDSIIVPVLTMAVMLTFGQELPNLAQYSLFLIFFLFAKLAVAGVPGGGILIAIPLLEKYFGFTSEMSGLIYAIYVLFDPLDTAANVMGNNSFAGIMSNLFRFKQKQPA